MDRRAAGHGCEPMDRWQLALDGQVASGAVALIIPVVRARWLEGRAEAAAR